MLVIFSILSLNEYIYSFIIKDVSDWIINYFWTYGFIIFIINSIIVPWFILIFRRFLIFFITLAKFTLNF